MKTTNLRKERQSPLSIVRASVAMAVIGCFAVMMATLTGCDKEDDGRGDSPGGAWTATVNGTTITLEINESARTYVMSANGESESGTFDPKTNEMYSYDGETSYTVNYNKSKDTLTLTDNDGIKVVFDRVGGGDNGGGGKGKIDPKLVGKWTYSSSGYWSGTSNWYATIERYEFHSDGTFSYYNETNDQSKGAKNGIRYEKGVFSVSGSEIKLTSIESKWEASDSNTVSTGWKSSQSRTEAYKLEEWYDGTYRLIIGNISFHQGD